MLPSRTLLFILLTACSVGPWACSSSSDSSTATADVPVGANGDGAGLPTDTAETPEDDAPTPAPDAEDTAEGVPRTCEGSLTLETAADVALVQGCVRVTGNLTIRAADLPDLSAVSSLEEVDGDLVIGGEFEPITKLVDAPITVGPALLTSLEGLSHLKRVGGRLEIGARCNIFAGMTDAGSVALGPTGLETLAGLEALEDVGSLVIRQFAQGNTQNVTTDLGLKDLSALDGVVVHGTTQLGSLPKVTALPKLVLPEDGSVLLEGVAITSLQGPTWPTKVNTLTLNATAITSLAGLEGVGQGGTLNLIGNVSLTDLSGLGATTLGEVNTDAVVSSAAKALKAITVTGTARAQGDFSALSHLELAGSVEALEVGAPMHLDGLGTLREVSGTLSLRNIADADLSALGSLKLATALSLGGALASLTGLSEGLVVQQLEIFGAAGLTDLKGLEGVVMKAAPAGEDGARSQLTVQSNPLLTSLEGAEGLTPNDAAITGNPLLPQCLVDAYLAKIGVTESSGANRPFCTCDGGEATCPYPLCEVDPGGGGGDGSEQSVDLSEATCVLQAEVTPSGAYELPKLVTAVHLYVATTASSISLPALEQAGSLVMVGDGLGLGPMPITQISAPKLQNVQELRVSGPNVPCPLLTSVDLSSLEHAGFMRIDCAGNTTALTTLKIPKLKSVDFFYLSGCKRLARCAVEAQLAGATIGEKTLENLDDACTCDAEGNVMPGTCTP